MSHARRQALAEKGICVVIFLRHARRGLRPFDSAIRDVFVKRQNSRSMGSGFFESWPRFRDDSGEYLSRVVKEEEGELFFSVVLQGCQEHSYALVFL